jgi:PAS domain-containing protein
MINVEEFSSQPKKSRLKEWIEKSQQDISQLKVLATGLQENERQLQSEFRNMKTIFHACPIPLFMKNKDLEYIEVNKAFEIFLNMTNEQIIGRTNENVFTDKKLIEQLFEKEKKLFESGGIDSLHVCHINEYQYRYWTIQETTYRNITTSVSGIVGYIQNNTKFIKQYKIYKKIMEVSPHPMILISKNNKILDINNSALILLEFNPLEYNIHNFHTLDIISKNKETDEIEIKYSSGEIIKNKIIFNSFNITDTDYTLISIL